MHDHPRLSRTVRGSDRTAAARAQRARPDHAARLAAEGRMSPGAMRALQRAAGNAAAAAAVERDEHVPDAGCGHAVQRSAVHETLRRPGRPLDPDVRTEMESRLDSDFSDVRVHTDAGAHHAAESVNAHAFTSGTHIVFQRGRYDTHSTAGRKMLAHELVHVVQQRSGPVPGTDIGDGTRVSDPSDSAERAAESEARRALSGEVPVQRAAGPVGAGPTAGPALQRVRAGTDEDPRETNPFRRRQLGSRNPYRQNQAPVETNPFIRQQQDAELFGEPPPQQLPQDTNPFRRGQLGSRNPYRQNQAPVETNPFRARQQEQRAEDIFGEPAPPGADPLTDEQRAEIFGPPADAAGPRQRNRLRKTRPPERPERRWFSRAPRPEAPDGGQPQAATKGKSKASAKAREPLDTGSKTASSSTGPPGGRPDTSLQAAEPAPASAGVTATSAGAVASGGLGAIAHAAALPRSIKEVRRSAKQIDRAGDDAARHRAALRKWKNSVGDTIRDSAGVVRNALTTTAGALRLTDGPATTITHGSGAAAAGAVTTFASVAGAAGGVNAAAGTFQMVREARKAVHATSRWMNLKQLMENEENPREVLRAAQQLAGELGPAEERLAALQAQGTEGLTPTGRTQLQAEITKWEEQAAAAQDALGQVPDLERRVRVMEAALGRATADVTAAEAGNAPDTPPLWMIQDYAKKKNKRGVVKKVAAAVGNAGTAGTGAAGLTLAIGAAAGAATAATPVGWAFAGLAAAVAIPLGGYKAWKNYSKRWKRLERNEAGEARATGERLKLTLEFWKSVSGSKRDRFAQALYDLASGRTDVGFGPHPDGDIAYEVAEMEQRQAQLTIEALGLSWLELADGDRDAAIKLIATKLAS